MENPSLLLFDLGGVLIESSVFERLNRLLPETLEHIAVKERWLFDVATLTRTHSLKYSVKKE